MSDSVPRFTAEGVVARPLAPGVEPGRLVVVRLHAFGDTVAVLPVLGALKARLPDVHLEVVTGPGSSSLFAAHRDVDAVHVLDAGAPLTARLTTTLQVATRLRAGALDGFLDLQRSRLSRVLRHLVRPAAFAAFDRFAPEHGLQRYLQAAERLGLGGLEPRFEPRIRPDVAARASELLRSRGWDPDRPLVCLNPAGGWTTKQWPLERYAALGRRLASEHGARLLLLGAGTQLPRVRALARELGDDALDLSGRTTADLAMAVVARASLAVSDDSGLMHLAWVQGVPTVGVFGASRSTWCRPWGEHTAGFYSEDLPCGACMSATCSRGDLHCLERVSVDAVLQRSLPLMRRTGGTEAPT